MVDYRCVHNDTNPLLAEARREAPYDIHRLVAWVNRVLGAIDEEPISRRTVRYYADEGILPPPEGPSRLARYGYEHLLRILAARLYQREGWTLDEIKQWLKDLTQRRPPTPPINFALLGLHLPLEREELHEDEVRKDADATRALEEEVARRLHRFWRPPGVQMLHRLDSQHAAWPARRRHREGNLRFPVTKGVTLEVEPWQEPIGRRLYEVLRKYLDQQED